MISERENKHISKFLSLVLRHQPETIGITLDDNGWANVGKLIDLSRAAGVNFDVNILKHVVDTNNKKRFAFDDTFMHIRASQGHSVEVDLGYNPQIPPSKLYHGTTISNVESILITGLEKRARQYVHLSADVNTATNVGQRHGKVFIFEVTAQQMHADGCLFYLSENGVWLTDFVPVKYLREYKIIS